MKTGLFSADKAQQQTPTGNQEKAQQSQTPAETTDALGDLVAVALGAADAGGVLHRLRLRHRNVDSLYHRRSRRRCSRYYRLGRKLTTAVDADSVVRICGHFAITVFTTHGKTSFSLIIGKKAEKCKI